MIKSKFHIPIYDVDVAMVQIEDSNDKEPIRKLLNSIGAREEDIQTTLENIENESTNGGDTYRCLEARKITVVFFPFTDTDNKTNIFDHEKRHVEDRILEYFSVQDAESAALLAGYLGVQFRKFEKLTENG